MDLMPHEIDTAALLAVSILKRANAEPIPLNMAETRLLARVVVQYATTIGSPAVVEGDSLVGIAPPTPDTCVLCGHHTSQHREDKRVGGKDALRACMQRGCVCPDYMEKPTALSPFTVTGDGHENRVRNAKFASLPYLHYVRDVADVDVRNIEETDLMYNGSWQKRGGTGAFMMLARKWDRLEERVSKHGYDVFIAIKEDTRREGAIDDVRDLRRYLTLVEAWCVHRAYVAPQTISKDSIRPPLNPPTAYGV